MAEEGKIILEGKNLSKDFNGNVVLNNVSIVCRCGEGLALAGENGAGKSTLMNIISGGLKPTSGHVLVDGKECHFSSPRQARNLGISFVHQELSLMNELTVGENIMLGHEPHRGILLDSRKVHAEASKVLNDIGFDVNPYALVKTLPPAERQIVEIAKAWATHPRVLIFDEPTSSLNKEDSQILYSFINKIKEKGVSVIVISHRMEDLFATSDRIVVLKDGNFVLSSKMKDITGDDIITSMVGRTLSSTFPERNGHLSTDIRLELKDICLGRKLKHINIQIPVGSVIGVGGLEGQGQRELCRGMFGIEPFTSGEYFINSKRVNIHSPSQAVSNKIAFISDDRKAEELFLPLSCADNLVSLTLNKNASHGVLSNKKIQQEVNKGINVLHVKLSNPRQEVRSLSGGNQQKIVLSKWIKKNPDILILHEPTRGIDVQSKLEIYSLIRDLAKKGKSIIVFTSDMLELIGISDVIYTMYEGEISGQMWGEEATEETVMMMSAKAAIKQEVNS